MRLREESSISYVEFDLSTSSWPVALPATLASVVTSMCMHHLPDDRKQALFAEIFEHLAPGGWYVNYDQMSSADPVVEATWGRVTDRDDLDGCRQAPPPRAAGEA